MRSTSLPWRPPVGQIGLAVVLSALMLAAAAPEARATVPAGYTQTTMASGLQRPVALAYLPDGRLLVGEQYTGKILVVKNGTVLATPFARLFPVYTGHNETGLLGLAVDPQFATNGWVYAFVTETSTTQKVYRFTAQGDVGTAQTAIISNLPSAGINHDGGGIGFGPDGKLYVSVGDNGNFQNDSQITTSRRGKLLRYNKDGTVAPGNPYGATNPAFCIGLRNTYRFCFQPGTGKIYATENGPNGYDEVNILESGRNYGWPIVTGINGDPRYVDPILEYAQSIAPTGITFYSGTSMPALSGQFLFVSYLRNKVMRATPRTGLAPAVSDFVTSISGPIDIAVSPAGEIAISTLAGSLYKVSAAAAPANQLPSASFAFTPATGVAPVALTFDGSGSSDPDGTIATYAWDFGDTTSGSGVRPLHNYALPGTFQVTLTVTDNRGGQGRTTQAVVITSTPGGAPVSAHVESPAAGSSFPGLTVVFQGHGHAAGQILEHDWTFGDGTPGQHFHSPGRDVNTTTVHTYQQPGTYTVSLTVEDDTQASNTHTIQVTVGTGGGSSNVVATYAAVRFEWRSNYPSRATGLYGEYPLTLNAGTTYEIYTSATVRGTSDDPYLYLRNPSNVLVAEDDDSGGGPAGRDSKIVYTPPATGRYVIRLRAYTRNTYGTTTLTVKTQGGGGTPPPVGVPEIRPGDVFNAQTFEWQTAFANRQDGDYGRYRLAAAAGTTYTLETANAVGGGQDTFLYVVNAAGTILAQNDDFGSTYLSQLVWTPPAAGDYYVKLRAYDKGQTGTCTLKCLSSSMPPGNPLLPDLITWVNGNYLKDAYIVNESGQKRLRFSNSVVNRGAGPLELYGVVNATTGETDAYQVVHHSNGARVTFHVGTFSFAGHATHNHWHFDEFALYELRNAATNALVRSSDKVSFCLLDLAPYTSENVPNSAPNGVYDCSNQGISVGWADVYAGGLEGQYVDITGVADGLYKLVSITDPNDRLYEEPNTNNRGEITVEIRGMNVTVR